MESGHLDQGCRQEEALVDYLYDECEPEERDRLEAHLATCHRCARELESLRFARGTLAEWTPPEPPLGFRVVSDRDTGHVPWWRVPLQPGWGLATAAVGVLLVGAVLASVEVRYGDDGFMFRMGWSGRTAVEGAPAPEAAIVSAEPASDAAPVAPEAGATPWRADLMALEAQLRREMVASGRDARRAPELVPAGTAISEQTVVGEDGLLREIQGLISQSERRQQQDLALWLTEFAQEFDMQRRADQQRMQQELGALEGFADYLVRVSQR